MPDETESVSVKLEGGVGEVRGTLKTLKTLSNAVGKTLKTLTLNRPPTTLKACKIPRKTLKTLGTSRNPRNARRESEEFSRKV
jgi:hypothetical protein